MDNYIEEVVKTKSSNYKDILTRINGRYTSVVRKIANNDRHSLDMIHAAMGISTEAGEILDNVKKYIFYNKPFDAKNLVEELGDLLWYTALMMDYLGVTFDEVQQKNIEKLRIRYGEVFSKQKALERDHDAEMKPFE